MTFIQRFLVGGVAIATFSSPIFAEDFYYDLHVGLSHLSINDGGDGANYTIGYGVNRIFDNKVFFGVSFDLETATISDTHIYGLNGDLKLGYNIWDKLNVYAIGGYKLQDLDGTSGYGLGYGAGMEYPITQHIITAIEYKTYHMSRSDYKDYDFDTIGLNLKYRF